MPYRCLASRLARPALCRSAQLQPACVKNRLSYSPQRRVDGRFWDAAETRRGTRASTRMAAICSGDRSLAIMQQRLWGCAYSNTITKANVNLLFIILRYVVGELSCESASASGSVSAHVMFWI